MTRPSMHIKLTVLSGPDTGMHKVFKGERVTMGRGGSNDFPLSDGFVSNFHGELQVQGEGIIYCDLKSRHGSLICVNNVSFHLHNREHPATIKVNHGTEIQIGCTLIKVALEHTAEDVLSPLKVEEEQAQVVVVSAPGMQSMRETLITSSHKNVQSLTQQFNAADSRLDVIFRLGTQLNGLTDFDAILDRIVSATFEAFPAANFFAMTLLDKDKDKDLDLSEEVFMRRRVRKGGNEVEDATHEQPVFSRSILKRVVETRESVLFVRDSLGSELSQSIIDAKITACLCAPLMGQHSLLGVVEVDTRGQGSLFSKKDLDLFSIVASLAAFAFERVELSKNIVRMFESFVYASVNAIEARDPTTAGHSERVTAYTMELARVCHELEDSRVAHINFSEDEFTELRYAGLLHDFGKIGVSEAVINKGMRLPPLHLDVIEQRFETIKSLHYKQHIHNACISAFEEGHGLSSEVYGALLQGHKDFCDKIDDDLSFLRTAACVGFLPDASVERVTLIAQCSYVDAYGAVQMYLTPFELENMSIRRGTLNEAEWDEMRSHSAQSRDYLERIPWSTTLTNIPYIAGAHHEKLDGSGYPDGLTAQNLTPCVRMMTIADIFDALTATDRPYRKAATVERAVSIIREEADQGKLDADFVEIFVEHVIPRMLHMIPSLQKSTTY